jgi:hypothetical protein
MPPMQSSLGGGGVERPAMLASSLPCTVSLLVSFLLVLLSSSVLLLTTSLMTESLMPLCGLVLVSSTFYSTKFSPLPTSQLLDFCLFFLLSCLTPFPLSRGLGTGPELLGGGRWEVRQHIHLFCMLQQFNILSLFLSSHLNPHCVIHIK